MKKTLVISSVIASLVLIIISAFWLFLNSSYMGKIIVRECLESTGSILKFGENPVFSLFPASVRLQNVLWQSPGKEPLLKFSSRLIRINFDLFSLVKKQIHINEIFADGANFVINENVPSTPASDSNSQSGSDKMSFLIDRLVVHHGQFKYFYSGSIIKLSQINLSAEHLGPRQEMDVKCDFYSDSEIEQEGITGNMAIRTKLKYYFPNLTFRQTSLTFTATEDPLFMLLSPLSLDGEGALNIDDWSFRVTSSQIKTSLGQFILSCEYNAPSESFDGHLSLDFNLASQKEQQINEDQFINYRIVLQSPFSFKNRILAFPDIAISAGPSKGSGNLKCVFPQGDQNTRITGSLSMGVLSLPAGDNENVSNARGHKQQKDTLTSSWPALDLSFSVAGLNYHNFSCRDLDFHLTGEDGVYNLNNLRFIWASGKANGSGSVNLKDKNFTLKTSGNDINIGRALWELGVNGFQDGLASYNSELASSGFDWVSIKKNLSGNISFKAQNVKVSVMEEITKFLSRFSSNASSLPQSIDIFTLDARANKGKLDINPLLLKSKALEAKAEGEINLEKDSLQAQLNLNIFGMNLPIALYGPLSGLSWRIEPAWLNKIWKEF